MKNNPQSRKASWGRKIPGFILQLTYEQDKITPTDKFYLSILHYLPETPTNKYMASIVGGGETEESARRHILKLENLGMLLHNHKKRKNKKISLNISTELRPGVHPDGITIDKILMKSLPTCSLRLVAAVELGFTVSNFEWKYQKIGMSKRAYKYNLELLEYDKTLDFLGARLRGKTLSFESKTLSFESKNEGKTELEALPVAACSNSDCAGVKRGLEFISRDINNGSLHDQSNQKHNLVSHLILADQMKDGSAGADPMINDSLLINNKNMGTTYMTKSEISSLKNTRISSPVIKIKYSTKTPIAKPSAEMSMIFQNYPLLTRHRIGSRAHLQAEKVIRGLKNGLVTEFSDYLNVIVEKGSALKLKKSEIMVAFQKKFTLKERKSIYQKFNDLLSPEYWPKDKKNLPRCLWDALSHTNKFSRVSWLMYFILKDPKHLEKCAIVDMDYEVELILRRWSKTRLQNSVPELKLALGLLNKWYYNEFLVPYYDRDTVIGGQWGSWEKFLTGYLNFLDDRYPVTDKNPGWFKPRSKPVQAWVREMLRFQKEIEKATGYSVPVVQDVGYQYA